MHPVRQYRSAGVRRPAGSGLAGDDSDSPGRARVQLFEQVHALLRRWLKAAR